MAMVFLSDDGTVHPTDSGAGRRVMEWVQKRSKTLDGARVELEGMEWMAAFVDESVAEMVKGIMKKHGMTSGAIQIAKDYRSWTKNVTKR